MRPFLDNSATKITITIPAGVTTRSAVLRPGGAQFASFHARNVGANALTDFVIEQCFHQLEDDPTTGQWFTLLGGDLWAATADYAMLRSSDDATVPRAMKSMAAADYGWAHIRLFGLAAIRFALSSTAGTTVDIYGGFGE